MNLSDCSIVTLDDNLLICLILNDVKYLNVNKQLFSPKTDSMIEEDLIKNFRFLGLDNDNFIEFLANNKIRWRLINNNAVKFFYFKYSANSLNTYNNSKNFDKEILEIGPGSGNLTEYIIEKLPKNLHVVEKDDNLALLLKEKFNNKINIINQDILKISETKISKDR